MDYKTNRKILDRLEGNTKALLLAEKRLKQIDNVLDSLNEEDRETAEIIFFEQYTQAGAEMAKNVTKAMYYNCMNKVIYLVAKEMELI
jgi:hypothetical protein